MGYCYDSAGRLCCEKCDTSGGVRRYRCPFGWCQPIALCPECARGATERTREYHRAGGCERQHADWKAREERVRDLHRRGEYVRCSALGIEGGRVHVLFSRDNGATLGYYMATATYHAIPLLEPATPESYRQHGEVRPAPTTYDHGRVTKEVTP